MPYVGRFNSIRKDAKRSPDRRYSRSPVMKSRKSRSPYRKRESRSPHSRRKSRSPVRRKSRSPVRRKSRSPNVRRRSRTPSPHNRKKSRSPQVRKKSRSPRKKSRSPVMKRHSSPKRHHSTSPKDDDVKKKRKSSSGPKVFMDTSNIEHLEPLINRKKTLNERFKTMDDDSFELEENITIGIQRNPYAPASSSVTVTKVFDPAVFTMIHHHASGRRPIFDRPELKYFRFDDMPHDDTVEYEKRTIKVAPAKTPASVSTSKRKSLHISRSPSPRKPTQVKLEMSRDPKYEKLFQESLREEEAGYKTIKHTKTINANDLRHNISRRHEDNSRFKLDTLSNTRNRERSRSRSRSRSRNRITSHSDSHSETDSSGFHRQPEKNKSQRWRENPSYTPKGISYYQSIGEPGLLHSLKGYISDVSEKHMGFKKKVEQFTFNFYTEKEFVKGISFYPNFWSTLKTVDGSTCLGVMFDRVKLRPPKTWKQWSLVLDKFSSLEAMLMPFDLSEDVRRLGKEALYEEQKLKKYENPKIPVYREKKQKSKNSGETVQEEDEKHDTRDDSGGQERRHFSSRNSEAAEPTSSDPRDSKPPVRGRGGFVRRGGYNRGGFGRGGFVRGRGAMRNTGESFEPQWRSYKGENFKKMGGAGRKEGVSSGKWKHDMFEQQVKTDKDNGTLDST